MRFTSLILYSPMQYLGIALVFICSALVSQAQAYQQDGVGVTVAADESYTVCSEIPVPPSYALVAITANGSCKGNTAFTVAPATDNLRICNLSETAGGATVKMPFPADFVVTSIEHVEYSQSKCGGATAVYVIKHVAEGITACPGSYIPNGWSFVQSTPSNGSCESMVRDELHQSVDGMAICNQSPYPANFVIGSVESVAACGYQERYVLRTVSDGVKACGPSKIPAGYVITGSDRSGRCGEYATLTVRTPQSGMVVCTISPIPDRYVISNTVPYSACENWTIGYQLTYIP
ncbi:hypothetical protein [Burkholderia pseudomallei]|uniref:hypothetical protein n=1 Tax=Burkholderia pseudomallei TaxID=28450 RepID=UPI00135D6DBF|nr:hypothetical protein [Burkholderia pseudomallei]MWA29780.1 hypothetical protein [Burkholderia pseudomallei]